MVRGICGVFWTVSASIHIRPSYQGHLQEANHVNSQDQVYCLLNRQDEVPTLSVSCCGLALQLYSKSWCPFEQHRQSDNGTDSGAAQVNTPTPPFSGLLAAYRATVV